MEWPHQGHWRSEGLRPSVWWGSGRTLNPWHGFQLHFETSGSQQVLCVPEGASSVLRLWRLPTSRESLVWALLLRDNKSSLIHSRPPPSPRDVNFAQKCFWRCEGFQRAALKNLFLVRYLFSFIKINMIKILSCGCLKRNIGKPFSWTLN